MMRTLSFRILAVILGIAAIYWLLRETGMLAIILNGAALRHYITALGIAGPLAVIGLLGLAIVVSPVPSAPIALAAGAAYGHGWGTLYVIVGSELGALIAFGLARLLGKDVIQRWFGDHMPENRLGSQNALMGIVFASRLLPFVSFDVVSYAAGLTALTWWRFALATVAGIAPASFLLTHFGSEMASGEMDRITYSALTFGLITLVPLAWQAVRRYRRQHGVSHDEP